MVELGCGPGHIEKYLPGVIKTDVLPHSGVHLVCAAEHLPFPDGSLRALFMVGVMHHLRDPKRFLAEAQRCLADGARLVLIEPSNSWTQRFFTNRFSVVGEFSDNTVTEWRNKGNGPLTGANIALPWVIFIRDRKIFEARFPRLRILDIRWQLWIAFYLSGGMTYRSFIPPCLLFIVRGLERFGGHPFFRWMATEMIVKIEKTG
jgi:SAM-dependent methyltransferase